MVLKKEYTTVHCESAVGKRLSKVRKQSDMFVVFQGRSIPITRRISVGRGSNNTIELKDSLASRYHAVIQKVKDEYFIEDLNSTNGTFVNGNQVPPGKYMRLHERDSVLIGRTRLSLRQFAARVLR